MKYLSRFHSRFLQSTLLSAVLLITSILPMRADQARLPAQGEWDGITQKAKLDRPYEDPRQVNVQFGLISYFVHPWRSYMDT